MQVCKFCRDVDTCNLVKRTSVDPSAVFWPCEHFALVDGLAQKHYSDLKECLLEVKDAGAAELGPRIVIENKLGTTVEAAEYLPLSPDLFTRFANTAFDDDSQRAKFAERLSDADRLVLGGAWDPNAPNHQTMLEIQAELRTVVNAYESGPEAFFSPHVGPHDATQVDSIQILNKWLGRLRDHVIPYPVLDDPEKQAAFDSPYQVTKMKVVRDASGEVTEAHLVLSEDDVYPDDEVQDVPVGAGPLVWRTLRQFQDADWGLRMAPMPAAEPHSNYALLFLQFAELVLSKQELCRCPNPNCRQYYVPQDRKNASQTCPRGACRMWLLRKAGEAM